MRSGKTMGPLSQPRWFYGMKLCGIQVVGVRHAPAVEQGSPLSPTLPTVTFWNIGELLPPPQMKGLPIPKA